MFLVLYSGLIKAQYFMPEIASEDMFIWKEVYVVTNNNDTIRGKYLGSSFSMGLLKSFNLKTSDATKMKFKAADVKTVAIKPNKIINIEGSFAAVGLKNLEAFNDVINREWIFYDHVQQAQEWFFFRYFYLLSLKRVPIYIHWLSKDIKGLGTKVLFTFNIQTS